MTAFTVDSARHDDDALGRPEPLAIVDQAAGVRFDIDSELVDGLGELAQVRIADLQPVHVVLEDIDRFSSTMLIAVPKQPFDPFQIGQ
jgi:hypothetical protein